MYKLILVLSLLLSTQTFAAAGDWFARPSLGVGYNSVQGSSMRAGFDLGVYFDDNLYAGAGAYYAAGQRPNLDREMGVGPFVGYNYPLLDFLTVGVREDIVWVDQRTPNLATDPASYDQNRGMLSYTYAGVHLSIMNSFGISAGYRVALGLSKSSLANGRSGTSLGLTLGF